MAGAQALYPDVVTRLETTTGPDRQIDFDIAFVLGWVSERPTLDRVEPLSEMATVSPSSPAPCRGGGNRARKALKDWTIEIDRDPYDAHVFDPAAADDGDELRMAAWRDFDSSLLMEKPPANPAIALTAAKHERASRAERAAYSVRVSREPRPDNPVVARQ